MPGKRVFNIVVGTVFSWYGLEDYLIIFTAGPGPLGPRTLSPDNWLDRLRDLYFMGTL